MQRRARLCHHRLGQHHVVLVEAVSCHLLEVEHTPDSPTDLNRQRQLGTGIHGRAGTDVIAVKSGVVDQRAHACAGDPAVDAAVNRLLPRQPLEALLGEPAGPGDGPQDPVLIEPVDRRQVVAERRMQLVHDGLRDLPWAVQSREPCRELARNLQAAAGVASQQRSGLAPVAFARVHTGVGDRNEALARRGVVGNRRGSPGGARGSLQPCDRVASAGRDHARVLRAALR